MTNLFVYTDFIRAVINSLILFLLKHLEGVVGFEPTPPILTNLLRKISLSDKYIFNKKSPYEINDIGVGLSYPDWIIKKWIDKYGEEKAVELCKYFNMAYPIMVRRNELKIGHNTFVSDLLKDKIFVQQYNNSNNFYYLVKGTALLFKNKLI